MIYSLNEARNVEEYRAEKAARERAEQDKKDKQYGDRYYGKNKNNFVGKIRADGHKGVYYAGYVGSRNRYNGVSHGDSKIYSPDNEDIFRDYDANRVADRNTKSSEGRREIKDAVNRNMRRHPERWDGDKPVKPKTESTIFDNIEII